MLRYAQHDKSRAVILSCARGTAHMFYRRFG